MTDLQDDPQDDLQDVTATCSMCSIEFIVPAAEQRWLREKFGETFALPRRCRQCRQRRREEGAAPR